MVYLQTVFLILALYFTMTMINNWIVINSPRLDFKIPNGFHNVAGRFAALFWGLFYFTTHQ